MKKKLMAMMMCLTLTVGTFAGCAGGETKEAEDSKTEEMSDKDSEQEVSKDTITITDHADREVEVPAEINRIVVADIYPMASVLTVFWGLQRSWWESTPCV